MSKVTVEAAFESSIERVMVDQGWVSVGPFKFDQYNKGSSFRAVKNDLYFEKDSAGRALPYLDSVYYAVIPDRTVAVSAFRAGRIDGTSAAPGTTSRQTTWTPSRKASAQRPGSPASPT